MVTLYHGTSVESGLSLLGGAPLSVNALLQSKIDGAPGFYMATSPVDAEYFALRRDPGTIVQLNIRVSAMEAMQASGAYFRPIAPGRSMQFSGKEFFVPPSAFPAFDANRDAGKISVTPFAMP